MSNIFSAAKLVVVKVGSALLVDGARGELRRDWLASLLDDVAPRKKQGGGALVVEAPRRGTATGRKPGRRGGGAGAAGESLCRHAGQPEHRRGPGAADL